MDAPARRLESLDLQAAARIFARIGVLSQPVKIGSRHEGAKAAVFIVGCDDGSAYAVKVYGEHYTERMLKELGLYRQLEGSSISLPRVVGWQELDEDLQCAVLVMSVIDGVPLISVLDRLDTADVLSVYRQIGEMQRELHKVVFDRFSVLVDAALPPGYDTNVELMRERTHAALTEFTALHGDAELASALRMHFLDHEDLFARCEQAVLCHNDFHDANVMVDLAQGAVVITGLIDFENAIAGDPLFDLSKTQNHARSRSAQTLKALVDGYGRMPEDWRPPFALYELFHTLELRNWYMAGGSAHGARPLERRMRRIVGRPSLRDRTAALFDR